MKRLLSVTLALCMALALPVAAQTDTREIAAEVDALVSQFEDGGALDADRIAALVDQAAARGAPVSFSHFDGPLAPITAPVTMRPPDHLELACLNHFDGPGASDAAASDISETITIDRGGSDPALVVYRTTDPQSDVTMTFAWDGADVSLRAFTYRDDLGRVAFTPLPDGSVRDAVSGAVSGPETPEARMLASVTRTIVQLNPTWFLSGIEVAQGQTALVAGRDADILTAVMAILGNAGTFGEAELLGRYSAINGLTEIEGAPHVLFEAVLHVVVPADRQSPDTDMRVVMHEVYDIGRQARTGYRARFLLEEGGERFEATVEETCNIVEG